MVHSRRLDRSSARIVCRHEYASHRRSAPILSFAAHVAHAIDNGAGEQARRDFDDDDLAVTRLMTSLEPRRLLHREVGRLRSARELVAHRILTSGSNSCARLSYQILKRGSPVLEIASAIQAFALALSAIRSARNGALSLRPPALMYCCAILPRDRQFSESSYFRRRSRTSTTHRLAASLN